MSAGAATVWADMLAHVRLHDPTVLRGWFDDLRAEDFSTGVLRIRAANEAQVRYLEGTARPLLVAASQIVTGRLISLAFACDTDRGNDFSMRTNSGHASVDGLPPDPSFDFDQFVSGPCNQLAYAAALAVAEAPGQSYNPLYVHGPSGAGKSHLLGAIANELKTRFAEMSCLYVSCDYLTAQFVEAFEAGTQPKLRDSYRSANVLILDDVHKIAGRPMIQEELFHILNALKQSEGQLVVSGRSLPSDMTGVEARLTGRLGGGLVAFMDYPCLETRTAIIRKRAKALLVDCPEEAALAIAARLSDTMAGMKEMLLACDGRTGTTAPAGDRKSTLSTHEHVQHLDDLAARLDDAVARRFGVSTADLSGNGRSEAVIRSRQVSMYLAKALTHQSSAEIGARFGGREEAGVAPACRSVAREASNNTQLRITLDDLADEVKNGTR